MRTDPDTGAGYSLGGASIAPGQGSVTVLLNKLPLPTAQITVLVFHDNQPLNSAPDLPQEEGLAGFQVNIREAGGRYGASGELVTQDAFGNPLGMIKTNASGVAIIKNLPPAKYGITISPPAGKGWLLTSTIEGTPTVDTWVKANEPPYLLEFGPSLYHVFFGFVKPTNNKTRPHRRRHHQRQGRQRPSRQGAGRPGLCRRTLSGGHCGLMDGSGRAVFVQRANEDSTFDPRCATRHLPTGDL